MQYSMFKHHVILNQTLKTRLVKLLIKEIRTERDGGIIDKTQIRAAIQMLIEVKKSSRKLYEHEFESVLLQETTDYYKNESLRYIVDHPCSAYIEKAQKRLHEEFERNSNYLSPSTEQKLIQTFLDIYLSDEITHTLLQMEQSGLVYMIKNDRLGELQIVYSMFSRRNDSFEILRKQLSAYINDEGTKLVGDTKLKNEDLVQKLIELNQKIITIMHKAM